VSQAYPLLLAAACFAGLVWLDRRLPAEFPRRLEAGLILLAGGLVGARLGFAALHWRYYMERPAEVAWLWQGGLSWVGAAAGVLTVAGLLSLWVDIPFATLMDALAVPAAVISLAVWTGCLVEGCAFGRSVAWGPVGYDTLGFATRRWPTQAAGMLLSGGVLAALLPWVNRTLRPGRLGAGTLTSLAGGMTLLSLTRGDPSLIVGAWRVDTIASAIVFLAGVALILRSLRPST
jgi:phosphatidylglycerol:prolipoprotein diacylglycerol transferase